jgi:hypothetical protein
VSLFGCPRNIQTVAAPWQFVWLLEINPFKRYQSLLFTVKFIEELLNKRDIMEVAHIAGWQIGLCEWRPKFGRFAVQEC